MKPHSLDLRKRQCPARGCIGNHYRCAQCGERRPLRIRSKTTARRFARDNFGASFDLDAECGMTCDNCGSPLTDRGAHGLGCERCAEAEESTMNGET